MKSRAASAAVLPPLVTILRISACCCGDSFGRRPLWPAAADAAFRAGGIQAGLGPLSEHGTLKLGEGPNHLHHHAARGSGGIDGFGQAAEPRLGFGQPFFSNTLIVSFFQCQFRVHALEPAVLGFELLDPYQLRDLEPAVLGFPFIISSRTDPVLAPQKWLRNFEQCDKWKLRARCWA